MEKWKDIQEYNGLYQISNLGNVKSLKRKKPIILKFQLDNNGYRIVLLFNGKNKIKIHKVHRLVALEWIENPLNKRYVNHKDGDKKNNTLSNLEWVTASENQKHRFAVLGHKYPCQDKFGKDNPRSKPVIQMTLEGDFVSEYEGVHDAARKTGFNRGAIGNCCRGNSNKHKNFKWAYK